MGAATPRSFDEADGGPEQVPGPPWRQEAPGTASHDAYKQIVAEARLLIAGATKDDEGRIKDDAVRWALGDLMVEMWPRTERTSAEASEIQAELVKFARDVEYKHSMLKDFYYVAEQWPPQSRINGESFARHSKLRGRADKEWALLGIDRRAQEELEPLQGLSQSQIRKVEKVLEAINRLDGESSQVLDAVVHRLKPRVRSKAKGIIAALRSRERQARVEAEAKRKAKSPLAIIFEYQSHLLGAAARAQALVEFVQSLQTQTERDYVRTVIEGTVYVNQKSLEDVLDALEEEEGTEDEDVINAKSEEAKRRRAIAEAS